MTKSNRRRHFRVSATFNVKLSTLEPERDPWTGRPIFRAFQDSCGNVSRGGAFVKTAEPLAPGRRILLEMKLPSGKPLEAIGRVAWSKRVIAPGGQVGESGVGVEFLGAARDEFLDLETFIDQNLDGALTEDD
jgi:Tfp pilus assembly protein PilZ